MFGVLEYFTFLLSPCQPTLLRPSVSATPGRSLYFYLDCFPSEFLCTVWPLGLPAFTVSWGLGLCPLLFLFTDIQDPGLMTPSYTLGFCSGSPFEKGLSWPPCLSRCLSSFLSYTLTSFSPKHKLLQLIMPSYTVQNHSINTTVFMGEGGQNTILKNFLVTL